MVPSHAPERTEEDKAKIARFKLLTEEVLPALAREQHWPIHFDHCFKRVCLDHAFGDVWYNHLKRPAERHIAGDSLRRALACAEDLAQADVSLVRERDNASLRWRGKPLKSA